MLVSMGVSAAENCATIAKNQAQYEFKAPQATGQPTCILVDIKNVGTNAINTFEYTYAWDGGETKTGSYDFSDGNTLNAYHFIDWSLLANRSAACNLVLDPPAATAGSHIAAVTLTKINGVANTSTSGTTLNYAVTLVTPPVVNAADIREFKYFDPNATVTRRGFNKKAGYGVAINISSASNPELVDATIVGVKMSGLPATGLGFTRGFMVPVTNAGLIAALTQNNNYPVGVAHQIGTEAVAYFPQPITLGSSFSYNIGFTFPVSELNDDTRYPIASYAMAQPSNQSYISCKEDQWGMRDNEWENNSTAYGAAPITVLYTKAAGCHFYYNNTQANKAPDGLAIKNQVANQSWKLPLFVRNDGNHLVTSVAYEYTIDNETVKHTGVANLARLGEFIPLSTNNVVLFDICGIPAGNHTIHISITGVNGGRNTSTYGSAYITHDYTFNFVEKDQQIPTTAQSFTYAEPGATLAYTGYQMNNNKYQVAIDLNPKINTALADKWIIGAKVSNIVTPGTDNYSVYYAPSQDDKTAYYYYRLNEVWTTPHGDAVEVIFPTPFQLKTLTKIGYRFDISNLTEPTMNPICYSVNTTPVANSFFVLKQGMNGGSATQFNDRYTDGAANITVYYQDEDPATGIENISADSSVVNYYDLMGRKVAEPQHGIFIMQQGNKVTKIMK